MLQRKVQLTGSSTLAVSLPKAWTKRYDVRPQTPLFIWEGPDGNLTVSRNHDVQPTEEARFDVSQFGNRPENLRRAFIAKYLAGSTSFRFTSAKPISKVFRKTILEESHLLIGLEVVDESEHEIHVQDFFSPRSLSLEKAMKRTHDILCHMQESISLFLETGDENLLIQTRNKDDEVDRLMFLVLRLLNASLNSSLMLAELKLSTNECIYYSFVIRVLESMADSLDSIAEHLQRAPNGKKFIPTRQTIRALNDEVLVLQRSAMKSFFERDVKKANETLDAYEKLLPKFASMSDRLHEKELSFEYRQTKNSMMWVARKAMDIADTAVDVSYLH